jgi:hypothetical protein
MHRKHGINPLCTSIQKLLLGKNGEVSVYIITPCTVECLYCKLSTKYHRIHSKNNLAKRNGVNWEYGPRTITKSLFLDLSVFVASQQILIKLPTSPTNDSTDRFLCSTAETQKKHPPMVSTDRFLWSTAETQKNNLTQLCLITIRQHSENTGSETRKQINVALPFVIIHRP